MNTIRDFILSLKTEQNASLIEALIAGQKAIFEDGALQRFNQMASEIANNYGLNALSFLQNSANDLASMYTEDDESELDIHNKTCDVIGYIPNSDRSYEEKVGYSFNDAPDTKNTKYTPPSVSVTAQAKSSPLAVTRNRFVPPPVVDKSSSFSNSFS